MSNPDDREDLRRMVYECLRWAEEHEEEAETRMNVGAFEGMRTTLDRGWPLSDKQRSWIRDVHEKLFDEPHYENAWSAGKVPRGTYGKTPTPEILNKPLPMKPPGRT